MNTSLPITGGCICGNVRYAIDAAPIDTSYCHCSDCRRIAGSPVVAWTLFPSGKLRWMKARPKFFHWANRTRAFCPECGSHLLFEDPGLPNEIEVATMSLDDENLCPPIDHTWMEDRLPWFEVADSLPRYRHYRDERIA